MPLIGRNIINVDIFTDAYRVSGRTQVGTSGLLPDLNNPNSDYLDLEDAYISRMHEPGKIVDSYSEASFRKSNINFIILQDRRQGAAQGTSQARSIFSRGKPIQIFMSVPAFEIHGEVMHDGKAVPSVVLMQTPGHFQPVFEGTASAALFPDISYSGDMILVQKSAIGIFCLARHKS